MGFYVGQIKGRRYFSSTLIFLALMTYYMLLLFCRILKRLLIV